MGLLWLCWLCVVDTLFRLRVKNSAAAPCGGTGGHGGGGWWPTSALPCIVETVVWVRVPWRVPMPRQEGDSWFPVVSRGIRTVCVSPTCFFGVVFLVVESIHILSHSLQTQFCSQNHVLPRHQKRHRRRGFIRQLRR